MQELLEDNGMSYGEFAYQHQMHEINKRRYFVWMHYLEVLRINSEENRNYISENIPDLCEQFRSNNDPDAFARFKSYYHQALVNAIEHTLNSRLKELVLRRHKAKVLLDVDEYASSAESMDYEMRMLMYYLSQRHIEHYIRLCLAPKESIQNQIENVFKSKLNTLLFEQRKYVDKDENNCKFFNRLVRQEWTNLTRDFLEEDLIIYAFNFLKNNKEQE